MSFPDPLGLPSGATASTTRTFPALQVMSLKHQEADSKGETNRKALTFNSGGAGLSMFRKLSAEDLKAMHLHGGTNITHVGQSPD